LRRFFSLLLVTTCLCSAPVARADGGEPSGGASEAETRQAASQEEADGVVTRSEVVGDASAARPTPIDPIRGVHAEAIFPFEGVGVYANTHGFALSRRAALYHVEGGASIPLDEGVRLTASFRLLSLDFGFDSDVERADLEPGLAAPFLGLAFDF
jgi:hypothetical protein